MNCPEHMTVAHLSMGIPKRAQYVAGFLFSPSGQYVALIEKNKPEWRRGLLNGIGGKIEPGETPGMAMRREFQEEAGLDLLSWRPFCVLTGATFRVHFFETMHSRWWSAETCTNEAVRFHKTKDLPTLNTIPNLKWLIPLALDGAQLTGEIRDPSNC